MIQFFAWAEVRNGVLWTMMLSVPRTKFRLLSSLLACEGLSCLVYSHDLYVFIKLVKLEPPHWHIFIAKFPNAIIKKGCARLQWLNSSVFAEAEYMLSRPNICILYSYMYLELFIGPTSGFYQVADCHSGNINDKL